MTLPPASHPSRLSKRPNMSLHAFMEKAMAPHSSTLAWEIPWMEEPGGLQSMGSWRVGHDWRDWATSLSLFNFLHWRRKCQPTPVFLPEESQGRGSLVGAIYGVAQSQTWLKWLSSSSMQFWGLMTLFIFKSWLPGTLRAASSPGFHLAGWWTARLLERAVSELGTREIQGREMVKSVLVAHGCLQQSSAEMPEGRATRFQNPSPLPHPPDPALRWWEGHLNLNHVVGFQLWKNCWILSPTSHLLLPSP